MVIESILRESDSVRTKCPPSISRTHRLPLHCNISNPQREKVPWNQLTDGGFRKQPWKLIYRPKKINPKCIGLNLEICSDCKMSVFGYLQNYLGISLGNSSQIIS